MGKKILKMVLAIGFMHVALSACGGVSNKNVVAAQTEPNKINDHSENRPFDGEMLTKILSAEVAVRNKNYIYAAKVYDQIAEEFPASRHAHLYAINYASMAGRMDLVTINFKRALLRYKTDKMELAHIQVVQLLKLALQLKDEKLLSNFVATIQAKMDFAALATVFADAEAYNIKGHSYDPDVLAYLQNRAAVSGDLDFYVLWIHALIRRDKQQRAEAAWLMAHEKYPHSEQLKYLHLEITFALGAYQKTLDLMEKYNLPETSEYLLLKAQAQYNLEDWQGIEDLLQALKKDPEFVSEANYQLALFLYKQKKYEVAINHLNALNDASFDFKKKFELGRNYLALRAYQKAIDVLTTIQSINLQQTEAQVILLSQVMFNAGNTTAAIELLDEFIEKYPSANAYHKRALHYYKLDLFKQFEQDMRTIIRLDPKDAEAYNNLGYVLANKLERAEEALELLKVAYELEPYKYYILDSLGWTLYRLNRLDEAIEYLNRSIELEFDPVVAAHLIEVLWKNNNKDQAFELWQKANKAFPKDEVLLNTAERLKMVSK